MRNRLYKTGTALISALLIAVGVTALRAQSASCTYGLPSVTSDAPASGGDVFISLITQTGCSWSVTADAAVTAVSPASGFDSATVQVTVGPNPDPAPRTVNVTLGDPSAPDTQQLFMVNQLGTACTFTIAMPPALVLSGGGSGSFRIATQPGCAWSVSADAAFVSFPVPSGVADGAGSATIGFTVDPNGGATDTRRSWVTVTNTVGQVNAASVQIAQAGETQGAVTAWDLGDVFAGIGSWWSDGGKYRMLSPDGTVKAVPDLNDASGMTTSGCAIDPNVANGDLFTTSWDGLQISRFSDATHQLVSSLDLSTGGLATVQRRTGTVPVPYTQNLDIGIPWPDITYTEQLVFDKSGDFFVGTSMYVTGSTGLGHAYLLEFAKNDDASVPGCSAAGPCLLDWWRVDTAGEAPTGQVPAGTNAEWTSLYKAAYASATGDDAAKTTAALAAVAPLAASLSYVAGTPPQAASPAGVDELDLSSDQHTVFYTSEDNRIRRFDTSTGQQLAPLTITDPDMQQPVAGKAYGFRLLPDGNGNADGSAGLIVAMSVGVFRTDGTGTLLKPAGSNVIGYDVDTGVSHPFAMNLTPDAQSFWVATSQEDSSQPTSTGGKIYRFHIPTRKRYGPFNIGSGGADIDIQGLCVKREYTAGVNQCYQTDTNGKGVLDSNGNPIVIACKNPVVCSSLGIDATGAPNAGCYPPGEVPLSIADRSSFEGDKAGDGGTTDLDLLPLTVGHNIVSLSNLPQDLLPVTDPATGYIVGVTGAVSYGTCPKALEPDNLASDPTNVCTTYAVGVKAADGASTSFAWNIHFRNAPPSITSQDTTIRALSALNVPTPAGDADSNDALIVRASASVLDAATNTWIPGIALSDFGVQISSGRFFPSAGADLAVIGNPKGYPLAAPNYPTVFNVTLDLYDCNNALADSFTPATDLAAVCWHHVTTTFKLTVVNELPRFVSGFGPAPAFDPIFVNSGVDQFSKTGVSLAAAGAEYTLRANDADQQLPIRFTFACQTAGGVVNGPGCDPATGLPVGLTYEYATAVPGVYAAAPDPANLSRTNQYVVIRGTPTTPANGLLITATLSDLAGGRNADPFTFRWTVYTNRPPLCSDALPSQALWPPNHKFVPVTVRGVSDPDGDAVAITITSIWQDEPVDTPGSGHTGPDAAGIGTAIASVRAERTGVKATPGDGRIYQINFTASDGKPGGTCTGAITVGVPHDQGRMSMPIDSGIRYDSITGVRIR